MKEIREEYDKEMEQMSSLMEIWGEQEGEHANCVVVRAVDADAGKDEVHDRACGIKFHMGVLQTALPEVACDRRILPDPYILQIVTRCDTLLL